MERIAVKISSGDRASDIIVSKRFQREAINKGFVWDKFGRGGNDIVYMGETEFFLEFNTYESQIIVKQHHNTNKTIFKVPEQWDNLFAYVDKQFTKYSDPVFIETFNQQEKER